ncbi:MAG: hypothetical protein M1358_00325 [Chloroflexi bacterium]|nr:hypothetical protein [Chloroflexota bacterium]
MTKTERVQAALRGEPVDRVPVSAWGHDYSREWSAEGLAQAMLERQRRYDWDFTKVNPRASYFVEDWGSRWEPSGKPHVGPIFVDSPIKRARDWGRLDPLDPEKGVLGEHLRALELIRDGLAGEVPFVQTIFSPLSIAKYLVGKREDVIRDHMREDPDALSHALSVIVHTFADYSRRCVQRGASGIFFATTGWASSDALDEDDYVRFGKVFDLEVLDAVRDTGWFHVLHNCGAHIFFELLSYYPVQAINWSVASPGNPSLKDALAIANQAVMGGIDEKKTLREGGPEQVAQQAKDALQQTRGVRFLLTPGCSIPTDTSEASLVALRSAVE